MKRFLVTTTLFGSLLFAGHAHADTTYIVHSGDTLSEIAKTYQISVDSIIQTNGLNSSTIYVGQTLQIPSNLQLPGNPPVSGEKILQTGDKYLGAPYVFGADISRTDIFDCSSFTKRVFLDNGIILPRVSKDQANVGKAIPLSDVQPGDLLFFDTDGNGSINHVGIYAGNGTMLNASSSKGVSYANLSGYWSQHFEKATRVLLSQPNTQLAAKVTSTPPISAGPFVDIDNVWNKEQILALHEQGIVKGSGKKFMPNAEITRAQLAVMLSRALELKEQSYDGRFNDVTYEDWFADQLMAVSSVGVVDGMTNGNFAPNEKVTRVQAVKMIYGAMRSKGYDETKLDSSKSSQMFKDSNRIPDWAQESLDKAVQANVISGKSDGNFDPQGNLTRAQMAKLIYTMLQFTN